MPRQKSVPSLKKICLVNVANNMDSLWCADYVQKSFNKIYYTYIIGPFEYLTSDLMQSLIDLLYPRGEFNERKLIKRHHLPLLVNSNVKTIDLTPWIKYETVQTVCNLLRGRCQKLMRAVVHNPRVGSKTFETILNFLPNLTSLDISRTDANDGDLLCVAACCHDLQALKLHDCINITDLGMNNLALPKSSDHKGVTKITPGHTVTVDRSITGCTNLVYLDVTGTNVSFDGMAFALRHFTKLQHLECADLSKALYTIVEEDLLTGSQLRLSLNIRFLYVEILEFIHEVSIADDYSVLEAACMLLSASATYAHVGGRSANEAIMNLAQLENLTMLKISWSYGQPVYFPRGLATLLEVSGYRLTSLELYDIDKVDFNILAKYCRGLKRLSCIVSAAAKMPFVPGGTIRPFEELRPFSCLEEITLILTGVTAPLPNNTVLLLLAYSLHMRVLRFNGVKELTDDVFDNILKTNRLHCIECVELTDCAEITGESVEKLLNMPNDLTTLRLHNCFRVSRADYERCASAIARRHYDVTLEWS